MNPDVLDVPTIGKRSGHRMNVFQRSLLVVMHNTWE